MIKLCATDMFVCSSQSPSTSHRQDSFHPEGMSVTPGMSMSLPMWSSSMLDAGPLKPSADHTLKDDPDPEYTTSVGRGFHTRTQGGQDVRVLIARGVTPCD